MSHVAIEKVSDHGKAFQALMQEANDLRTRIQERAFEFFQGHGATDGSALTDWANAERELLRMPEADLIEKDGSFEIHLGVPGFDDKDIKVRALPDAILVSAQSRHKHTEKDGKVHFCEFGEKQLFRCFDLPASIDVDAVHAKLDKGALMVSAPKLQAASPKKVAVSAVA